MAPLQGEGMTIWDNKVNKGPASGDQGLSTASQGSYHDVQAPYTTFVASIKNGLRQLITCDQSQMMPKTIFCG